MHRIMFLSRLVLPALALAAFVEPSSSSASHLRVFRPASSGSSCLGDAYSSAAAAAVSPSHSVPRRARANGRQDAAAHLAERDVARAAAQDDLVAVFEERAFEPSARRSGSVPFRLSSMSEPSEPARRRRSSRRHQVAGA